MLSTGKKIESRVTVADLIKKVTFEQRLYGGERVSDKGIACAKTVLTGLFWLLWRIYYKKQDWGC